MITFILANSIDTNLALDTWGGRLFAASWQGGLFLVFAWMVCQYCKTLSATTRCWIWRIAYIKFALILVFGGLFSLPILPAPPTTQPPEIASRVSDSSEASDWDSSSWESDPFFAVGNTISTNPSSILSGIIPDDLAVGNQHTTHESVNNNGTRSKIDAAPSSVNGPSPRALTGSTPLAEPMTSNEVASIVDARAVLFTLWMIGCGTGIVFVARDCLRAQWVLKRSRPLVDRQMIKSFRMLCSQLKMSKPPRLAMTLRADSPMLVGVLHPTILIPQSMVKSYHPSDLRMVLAHELAHAKRNDLVWNWLLIAVRTLFFFHPLVWLTQSRFSLDQEIACDQMALKTTKANFQEYGNLLVKCSASTSRGATRTLAAVGAISSFKTLKLRILEMNRFSKQKSQSSGLLSIAVVMASLLFVVPINLVAQQSSSDQEQDSKSSGIRVSNQEGNTVTASSSSSSQNGTATSESNGNSNQRNVSVTVNNDEGRTSLGVRWKNDGTIGVTYTSDADGSKKTQKYNLKDISELEQKNPQAYAFYKQHVSTNNNSVTARVGNITGTTGIGVGQNSRAMRRTVGMGSQTQNAANQYGDRPMVQAQSGGQSMASSASSWSNSASRARNGVTQTMRNSGGTSSSSSNGSGSNEQMIQQIRQMMEQNSGNPQMQQVLQQMLNQAQSQNQAQGQNQGQGQGQNQNRGQGRNQRRRR